MDVFYSRCLLCACTPADLTPHLHICSEAGNQLQLADKISKYLNIQIDGELPQNVCCSCMEKLEVTHELVTCSQQARVTLLQIKQQTLAQEIKREILVDAMTDSCEPSTESYNSTTNEMLLDNTDSSCSVGDFGQQSDSASSHVAIDITQENFEEVLISDIDVEEHYVKLEAEGDRLEIISTHQLDQMRDVLRSKIPTCRVLLKKLLQCDSCSFYTDSKDKLTMHMRTHKARNRLNKDKLTIHMRTHKARNRLNKDKLTTNLKTHEARNNNLLRCESCRFKTDNKIKLTTHMQTHRLRRKPVKKNTRSKSRRHLAHVGIKLHHQCADCMIRFVRYRTITWHREFCHGPNAIVDVINVSDTQHSFQCRFCKAMFKKTGKLIHHLFSEHRMTNLPFGCDLCGKTSTCSQNMNKHVCKKEITSDETPANFKCKLCNTGFEAENLMKNHVATFHARKKNKSLYKCGHCKETFQHFLRLQEHCQKKHPGKYILRCDVCLAEFWTQKGFVDHKAFKHTGLVVKCKLCPSTFRYPTSLKFHMRNMHSQKQPVSCRICKVKLKDKHDLREHLRSEHFAPTVSCEICDYVTHRKGNLRRHIIAKHLKKSPNNEKSLRRDLRSKRSDS